MKVLLMKVVTVSCDSLCPENSEKQVRLTLYTIRTDQTLIGKKSFNKLGLKCAISDKAELIIDYCFSKELLSKPQPNHNST